MIEPGNLQTAGIDALVAAGLGWPTDTACYCPAMGGRHAM